MKLHMNKINRALYVLKRVKKGLALLKAPEGAYTRVDTFENGREQGFCIRLYIPGHVYDRRYCFAENRASDHMVLYEFTNPDYNPGNHPDEEAFKNRYLSKISTRRDKISRADAFRHMDDDVAIEILKRILAQVQRHIEEVSQAIEPILKKA